METIATEFVKLGNTILVVIKKIRNKHQGADINHIIDKTIYF